MHYMIADEDRYILTLHVNAYRAHGISFRWAALIFLPKLIDAAARIACDSGPTGSNNRCTVVYKQTMAWWMDMLEVARLARTVRGQNHVILGFMYNQGVVCDSTPGQNLHSGDSGFDSTPLVGLVVVLCAEILSSSLCVHVCLCVRHCYWLVRPWTLVAW